jgi:hypothetical protein
MLQALVIICSPSQTFPPFSENVYGYLRLQLFNVLLVVEKLTQKFYRGN